MCANMASYKFPSGLTKRTILFTMHTPSVTIMHNSVTHTPPHTNKLRMIVMVSSDSGGRQCLSTQGDGDADR